MRSDRETTLYRRVVRDPFLRVIEVFSQDPEKSVSRTPIEVAAGTFSVVVPELGNADHVAILSSAGTSRTAVTRAEQGSVEAREEAGAVEVARFPLRVGNGR